MPRAALALALFLIGGRSANAQSETVRRNAVGDDTGCRADSPPGSFESLADGAVWWCRRGSGDSVRVVLRTTPPDSEVDLPRIRLLEVHAKGLRQDLPVHRLAIGFGSADLEAVDLDGDGRRELILRLALPRGTNQSNLIWHLDPRARRYRADAFLSSLLNVQPAAPGCVTTVEPSGPDPDDLSVTTYCWRGGRWAVRRRARHSDGEGAPRG